MTGATELKSRVAEFWDRRPCGSFSSGEPPGTRRFFEQIARYRYRAQPFMRELAGFERFAGQRLLEVGCGLGTDLRQFAAGGARVIGVDLSRRSVALAREHFRIFDSAGHFLQSDCEHLPFADACFDVVYSFGVLHHTPDTRAAIGECYRVLRPGGIFMVMLYHRRSWHVMVEPYLLAAKRALQAQPVPRGFTDAAEVVRRYDGVANPLGRAYALGEVRQMLGQFGDLRLRVCQPRAVNGSWLAKSYSGLLRWSGIGRRWGFWIVAEARRPR
ncbi:MAG: class I SAM-dependent methyltransferase [Gemmatimonadetes bacterium]|nr:class I SAM-dependent methyltransferase [Gemmatimonadota bacterium]